ncbi:hypothetical protein PISMIDRAFT_10110 [Pisolithus microcarpus 441]|uniref:Uncharacterized protein n=1 Tax=Pisolithus microcarpus 441 TaxID=765257 RepID=A0A0C9ZFG1_9AGAM|nr:hypothetical protein PISMIDRAFT_10110 [Pisolithus microcarpus 441]
MNPFECTGLAIGDYDFDSALCFHSHSQSRPGLISVWLLPIFFYQFFEHFLISIHIASLPSSSSSPAAPILPLSFLDLSSSSPDALVNT